MLVPALSPHQSCGDIVAPGGLRTAAVVGRRMRQVQKLLPAVMKAAISMTDKSARR